MAINSETHNKESSARLRELISHKRERGELKSAVSLAKIGRRVVLQADRPLEKDEASRKAFELYLEFEPNDKDVQKALDELLKSTPKKSFNRHDLKANRSGEFSLNARERYGLVLVFCLLATGVAARFSDSSSDNSSLQQTTRNIEIDQTHSQESSIASSTISTTIVALPTPAPSIVQPVIATPAIVAAPIVSPPIIIRAVGDVVLGTNYPNEKLPDEEQQKRIIELSQSLVQADVAFGNLEGVLCDGGKPKKESKTGYYSFRMPASYAMILKDMGFNVVSVANNHSLDFGSDGLNSTIKALEAQSIKVSGASSTSAIVEVRKTKIAFLSYSYLSTFTRMDNEKQIAIDITNAKQQADLVFVSVHAGGEGESAAGTPETEEYFMNEYRGNVRKFAEFVIDAGASGVFGHGPHVIRPFEIYKQKPIFYSLGNFIGFRTLSTKGKLVQSIIAEVRFNADGTFLGAGIIPLKMDYVGIPSADYTFKTLTNLDGLLNENLDKQLPLLVLKMSNPAI